MILNYVHKAILISDIQEHLRKFALKHNRYPKEFDESEVELIMKDKAPKDLMKFVTFFKIDLSDYE